MLRRALIASSLTLVACSNVSVTTDFSLTDEDVTSPIPEHQRNSPWFTEAREKVARAGADGKAKNVIFFLGDGMGISTVTAARILAGQRAGNPGEETVLSFEEFPVTGLIKTYNVDSQTPDSAGTMSAITTGVKTDIGVFGVDEAVVRNNCASAKDRELLSILDIAELAGVATGVVTTTRITHATPAATYAKTANRDWEDDKDLPAEAAAQGCVDIASQFIDHSDRLAAAYGTDASDGIEVALGGGRRHFLSAGEEWGRRSDGRNLISEWQSAHPDGSYAGTKDELRAIESAPVLGLFSASHMDYASQRVAGGDQPSLSEMTLKAIELLERSDKGYLLIVEAGRIDHAHHAGNAANALGDTVELSETVAAAMNAIDPSDTLVMVTADHSHVFTMAGYPRRGNPILGKVVPAWSEEPTLDEDGRPYTTLGYMNGRGFRDLGDELDADVSYETPPDTGRKDLSEVDTTTMGYHQEALVPTSAETHGGEDVTVYATGPGSAAAGGVNEQNLLFHVMLSATGWEQAAAKRVASLEDKK
ncbi:MAG: alkaline phosphatase [Pseudomonadota bacterium]